MHDEVIVVEHIHTSFHAPLAWSKLLRSLLAYGPRASVLSIHPGSLPRDADARKDFLARGLSTAVARQKEAYKPNQEPD